MNSNKNAPKLQINNSYDSDDPSSGSSQSCHLDVTEDDLSDNCFIQSKQQTLLTGECGKKIIASLQGLRNNSDKVDIPKVSPKAKVYHNLKLNNQHTNIEFVKPIATVAINEQKATLKTPVSSPNQSVLQYSSQGSELEGFSNRTLDNQKEINELIETSAQYAYTFAVKSEDKTIDFQLANSLKLQLPPVKELYNTFYDTIIEDNSCNAIDMQLEKEQRKVVKAVDLSFNGKFINNECASTSKGLTRNSSSFVTTTTECNFERSPDLFSDDYDDGKLNNDNKTKTSFLTENSCAHDANTATTNNANNDSFLDNCKRDEQMLRRMRQCLNGVPPPPSKTILQFDLCENVSIYKNRILNFFSHDNESQECKQMQNNEVKSLLKPTHNLEESKTMPWESILGVRQHGLSYNLSRASEMNDFLGMALIDRYIGNETASTYKSQQSPSSAKKRNVRFKQLTQSPGSRLSHLAKRRSVFSSATMNTAAQKLNNSLSNQVLIEKKKKAARKLSTPKRRTPSNKRRARKTPSSSARKRLQRLEVAKPAPSRETLKRALFQSPNKQFVQRATTVTVKPNFNPEIANRVEKSKRALFSPDNKHTQSDMTASNESLFSNAFKRTRSEAQLDDSQGSTSKMFCANGEQRFTARALNIKSQSYCMGAGYSVDAACNQNLLRMQGASLGEWNSSSQQLPQSTASAAKLKRAQTDLQLTASSAQTVLSESQRKKLLWAVSLALQEKKINNNHEDFKKFAATLARLVKRIYQDYYLKSSAQLSTSETMHRLSKKYVYHVINGRNAEELFAHAKKHIEEKKAASSSRLSGYIGPEEFKNRQATQKRWQLEQQKQQQPLSLNSMHNASSENCHSQLNCTLSQQSYTQDAPNSASKLCIQPNASLQNSSSKSNLEGFALQENVDCEQRRSAQKNPRSFSPFAAAKSAANKSKTIFEMNSRNNNSAKRQISFDF